MEGAEIQECKEEHDEKTERAFQETPLRKERFRFMWFILYFAGLVCIYPFRIGGRADKRAHLACFRRHTVGGDEISSSASLDYAVCAVLCRAPC